MAIKAPNKVTITVYTDSGFKTKATMAGNPFTVWINPASYTHSTRIDDNDRQSQDSSGPSPEFDRVNPGDINFELIFDATAVVPAPGGQSNYINGVADGIATLRALTVTTNGTIQSPNFLILSWAHLQFQCVLTSMNVNYTLFMPDGTPLRAKVAVAFQSYTSERQLTAEEGKESSGVTHLVTVIAGDTLHLGPGGIRTTT